MVNYTPEHSGPVPFIHLCAPDAGRLHTYEPTPPTCSRAAGMDGQDADDQSSASSPGGLTPNQRKKAKAKQKKLERAASVQPAPPRSVSDAPATSDKYHLPPPSTIFPAQQRGYDAVCALLRAAAQPQAEVLSSWQVRPPSGVLLSGPPGTGKTHLVRAAAAEFGIPLVAYNGGGTSCIDAVDEAALDGSAAAAPVLPDPIALLVARRARLKASPRSRVVVPGLDRDEDPASATEESGVRLRRAFVLAERLSRRATLKRGHVTPAILFLDELDAYCPKRDDAASTPEQRRCVTVLLTLLDGLRSRAGRVLAVAATNRPDALDVALRRPGRLEWEVPLTLPSGPERETALARSCIGLPLHPSVCLAEVAKGCSGYAAADLVALAREALLCAARRRRVAALSPGAPGEAAAAPDAAASAPTACPDASLEDRATLLPVDFEQALSRSRAAVLRPVASTMAAPVEPLEWDAIGGAGEAKLRLRRAVEWPTTKAERYAHFGIRPPRGVLLHGPPGCAKTSLARAAAGATGVSFLYLSGASLYSPFVGEAERAIRELFALGRACAPAILFLDELEAIVGSRASIASGGGTAGGGDSVHLRVLSTLLNEMDGIAALAHVVVIGATNRPDMLDPALLRPGRFDDVVRVDTPDAAGRLEVLSIHTATMPLGTDVDLSMVANACTGWSGAQIGALCREAGMQAMRENISTARQGSSTTAWQTPQVCARHIDAAVARVSHAA